MTFYVNDNKNETENENIVNIKCILVPKCILIPSEEFFKKYHSSIGIFQIFKIVLMVPNRATHHICKICK